MKYSLVWAIGEEGRRGGGEEGRRGGGEEGRRGGGEEGRRGGSNFKLLVLIISLLGDHRYP